MKIRDGFVTNSSSTNFLIISKNELTIEYLLKKLGMKEGSPFKNEFRTLGADIINGIEKDDNGISYQSILEVFGEKSAEKYKKLTPKGYFTYTGQTDSDSEALTLFFTTDCFEYNEKDIYINGLNCVW